MLAVNMLLSFLVLTITNTKKAMANTTVYDTMTMNSAHSWNHMYCMTKKANVPPVMIKVKEIRVI